MAYQSEQGKTSVGLFVDGQQLKYVQLSLTRGRVHLRDFKTVTLEGKLENKTLTSHETNWAASEPPPEDTALSTSQDFPSIPAEAPSRDATTNATLLFSLLRDLAKQRYSISIALSEPAVRYYEFESDFGLSGDKLKQRIVHELSAAGTEAPTPDSLGIIPTAAGKILTVVRQGELQLYSLLTEAQGFAGGDLPTIKLVQSGDLALMEVARSSYEFHEKELSALVYVGVDFSRVIFMQGNDYLHHAPIISEGVTATNIDNTICSRIRLEQENPLLGTINRIFLAGESHKINLAHAMSAQFPSAHVEYLQAPDIVLSPESEPTSYVISEYAIPLAVAWRALQSKLRGAYGVNLIPAAIVESQRAFSLAWYGWMGVALIVVSLIFFGASLIPRQSQIKSLRESLGQQHDLVGQLNATLNKKRSLEADMAKYEKAMKAYVSITRGAGRWTRILDFLSATMRDINSIWIESIRPVEGNPAAFDLGGRAYVRSRITRLVNSFEKASLLQLRTVTIKKRDVYEFDIRVEKVNNEDIPYLPPRISPK